MKLFRGIVVTVFSMLLFACTAAVEPAQPTTIPAQSAEQPPTQDVFLPMVSEPDDEVNAGEACPIEHPHAIGQSIDEEFDEANYDQIMSWFCAGASFEDIVVALQTEEMTDVSAEELLEMVVEGYSWEDIWDAVGLK